MVSITSRIFDPSWWRKQSLTSLGTNGMNAILFSYYKLFYDGRCQITEEDWDNLVILDACRHDTFEKLNSIDGSLERRISKGTNTGEFLGSNFGNKEHLDIVYVTANPHVSRLCEGNFHSIVPVWETDWDEELNTVTPATMVKATKEAAEMYPNKRIVSHFVQPHAPYIGPYAREAFGIETGITLNRMMATGELENDLSRQDYPNSWSRFIGGEISREDMIRAYEENLELVLEPVSELVDHLSGKTVITSDHGEMFGEMAWPLPVRKHGHGTKIHYPTLAKVPWLTIEYDSRRETVAEQSDSTKSTNDEQIKERLRDLGYVE